MYEVGNHINKMKEIVGFYEFLSNICFVLLLEGFLKIFVQSHDLTRNLSGREEKEGKGKKII